MKRPTIRKAHGPEYDIQKEICKFLRDRGWHVERIVGIGWQYGLPDLLICHPKWGIRFVEIKNEDKYGFTKAQKCKFPILMDHGCGIWVLTEASDKQYERLFKTPNLWDYLDRRQCPTNDMIDELLKDLDDA